MNTIVLDSFFSNLIFLFNQIRKILFAGKFYIALIVVIGVFNILPITIGHILHDPMPVDAAFYFMNMVPAIVLALFLSMFLVSYEKDNKTIEGLFSIPGSPYKVWLYKLSIEYFLLFSLQVMFALITFFFVDDFSIELLVITAFVPVFFAGNLTFFFSTVIKSGIAAGIVAFIVLFIFFPVSVGLAESNLSQWTIYMSPFMKPNDLDIDIWNQRLLYNKLAVFGLGVFFMYFGLKNLRKREPFL